MRIQTGRAIALAFTVCLVLTGIAHAGQYTIHNCPGSLQPNFDAGPWQSYGGSLPSVGGFQNSCSPGGTLGAAIGWYANEQGLNTNLGVLIQTPSSATTIREMRLVWSVSHQSSGSDPFAQVISDAGSQLIASTPYSANPAQVHFPSGTRTVYVYSYCSYDASTNCYFPSGTSPVIKLEGMDTTLEESNPPTATVTNGSLAANAPVSGVATLDFTASDGESGVRESQLLIDGSPVLTDSYSSQCPYTNFAACPRSVPDSMTWDSHTVANGEHRVALRVTDAAGNTQVLDDHAVLVSNPSVAGAPPPSAAGNECAAAVGTQTKITVRQRRIVSAYLRRARLSGTLTGPSGSPVAGATIEALAKPTVGGNRFSALSHATTSARGQFKLTLPPGISRTVCLRYRALPEGRYAAAIAISQQVRVGMTLAVQPSEVEPNGTIFLTGRVLGGYISSAGKVVELQVLYLGSWRVFQTLRSQPNGEFTAFYTFIGGHGTFAFRARVRGENDYPYIFGYSHPVTVRAG